MDSSKRHWPSMFKSKPCNNQWQHDMNSSLISTTTCHKTPLTSSVGGCEERTPEPKPRWNPKPEQIRILESIFNSGMVNPPREEIRRIRCQLQEYGQVGDANVFYWFQNRKSRSKHKQRHLQTTTTTTPPPKPQTHNLTSPATTTAPRSSSSSSSDKSSQKSNDKAYTVNVVEGLNSPTGSVNQQPYFQTSSGEFLAEPYFLPINYTTTRQGFCYQPEVLSTNVVVHDQTLGICSSGLTSINELTNVGVVMNDKKTNGDNDDREKFKELQQQQHQHQQLGYSTIVTSAAQATVILPNAYPSVLSTINHIQGHEGQEKSTVFINDVAFEVTVGPFNVKEAFGDDAVLMHSSGQPVVTNEWGLTLLPLQHGAFYYLMRMLAPSPIDHRNSIDMI